MTHGTLSGILVLSVLVLALATPSTARYRDRIPPGGWTTALGAITAAFAVLDLVFLLTDGYRPHWIPGLFLVGFAITWTGAAAHAAGRGDLARYAGPAAAVPASVVLAAGVLMELVLDDVLGSVSFESVGTVGTVGAILTSVVFLAVVGLLLVRTRRGSVEPGVAAGLGWAGLSPGYAYLLGDFPFLAYPGIALGTGVAVAFWLRDPRDATRLDALVEGDRPAYIAVAAGTTLAGLSVLALVAVLSSFPVSAGPDGGLGAALAAAALVFAGAFSVGNLLAGVLVMGFGTVAKRHDLSRGSFVVSGAILGWIAMVGVVFATAGSERPFLGATVVNPIVGAFLGWVTYRYARGPA